MRLPLTKKAFKKSQRETATSLPVVLEGEAKSRTRNIALRAVRGDIDELDLANLDTLGRITGQLKNTYIESVSAAKITSATMLATTLTLAGTDASANKTSLVMMGDALFRVNDGVADRVRISNAGVELAPLTEGVDAESAARLGLSMIGVSRLRLGVYDNSVRRGWQMRADGDSGGKQGRLTFIVTRYPSAPPTDTVAYANAILSSEALGFTNFAQASGLSVRNSLSVIGPMRSTGGIESDGTIYTSSGVVAGTNVNANGNLNAFGGVLSSGGKPLSIATGGELVTFSSGISATALSVGAGNVAARDYNLGGATAYFGGPIQLGGSLLNPGHRIAPSEYSAITSVSAGATVTLSYRGGSDPLWVETKWRVPGGGWRHTTASGATTGVSQNAWSSNGMQVTNHTTVAVEVQAMFWR